MKTQLLAKVLLTTLALTGVVAFNAEAQPPFQLSSTPKRPTTSNSKKPATQTGTNFQCVKQGDNYATVGFRGSQKAKTPLIVWTTNLASDNSEGVYTAENRCKAVSTRLTNLSTALGKGSFQKLWLDYGYVNSQVVICVYDTSQPACNSRNIVFTLKPENRSYADEILANLKKYTLTGSGSPIFESEDSSAQVPKRAVSLEAWEKQSFSLESESPESEPQASPEESSPSDSLTNPSTPGEF